MPVDPVLLHLWLFEWHPSMERVAGQNYRDYETRLAEQRIEAVKSVFEQKGWDGIEELIGASTNPYTVGWAIASIEDETIQLAALQWGAATEPSRLDALQGYFFACSRTLGRVGPKSRCGPAVSRGAPSASGACCSRRRIT